MNSLAVPSLKKIKLKRYNTLLYTIYYTQYVMLNNMIWDMTWMKMRNPDWDFRKTDLLDKNIKP